MQTMSDAADNYTSNQRIIPINNFITTPRNYWFHGIYFRKWFMLILNITLVTLGRLTDVSLNKNGGSREAVKKKGSVWVEGELIRRPFLTRDIMSSWRDIMSSWRDTMSSWRDTMSSWRDTMSSWRDTMSSWRDIMSSWRDIMSSWRLNI